MGVQPGSYFQFTLRHVTKTNKERSYSIDNLKPFTDKYRRLPLQKEGSVMQLRLSSLHLFT